MQIDEITNINLTIAQSIKNSEEVVKGAKKQEKANLRNYRQIVSNKQEIEGTSLINQSKSEEDEQSEIYETDKNLENDNNKNSFSDPKLGTKINIKA